MSRKKHTVEQAANLLRQVEVAVAHGKTAAQAEKGSGDYGAGILSLAQGVWRVAGGPGEVVEGVEQ